MSNGLHVGGEVESYCGSCKDMRWHIVVAMVGDVPAKVECVSCHKQHGYRTGPASSGKVAKPRSPAAKKRSKADEPPTFDLSMLEGRAHLARAYTPATTFNKGDVVRHPTFGLGIVADTPSAQKMDVRFDSGPRLLVHDRKPTT